MTRNGSQLYFRRVLSPALNHDISLPKQLDATHYYSKQISTSGRKSLLWFCRESVVELNFRNISQHFEIKLSWLVQMAASKNVKVSAKAPVVFGNIDEIYNFHSETLMPQLENCNNRWSIFIVQTFKQYIFYGEASILLFIVLGPSKLYQIKRQNLYHDKSLKLVIFYCSNIYSIYLIPLLWVSQVILWSICKVEYSNQWRFNGFVKLQNLFYSVRIR